MNKLKATYIKLKPRIIIFFSVVMIGIALLNIYSVLEVKVTSNDECLWVPEYVTKDSSVIHFDKVKLNGVTWNAGIRNGDQLLEINGVPLNGTYQAQAVLNKVKGGDYAEYVVKKPDGKILTAKVYIKKLIQYGSLASSLSALIWFLIGFVVLMAKPDGRTNKLFYAIGTLSVFAAMEALLPWNIIGVEPLITSQFLLIVIMILWAIGISFIGAAILYFFWIFPHPFKFAEKKWVKRLLIIVPSLFFVLVTYITARTFVFKNVEFPFFIGFISFYSILMGILQIVAIISIFFNYKRMEKKEQKKPLLLMIIAFIFGMAVSVYASRIAPAITDLIFNSPEYYAPIVLIALVPLVIAYAVFKYQLMDVSAVIRNAIVYGTATVSIAAFYFLVIYLAGHQLSKLVGTENQGIVAGVFFVIFALVFQSTKDRFQDFITKRFYPEQFAHQRILVELSNQLATAVGISNILELLKHTFINALKISRFGIMIVDERGGLKLVESFGLNEEEYDIEQGHINDFIKKKSLVVKYPAIERSDFSKVLGSKAADKLLDDEIYTIIPMMIKQKVTGLLLFGLKHSGSQFSGKDLELLWAAANQAAVSIENARLYESEAEKLKLERDLDLARKIQSSLLPTEIPRIKNLDVSGEMIPAMQVGGDYFDLLPVNGSDSKLFVVIGDVSGKGLSASLYMTKLQTMVKFACTSEKSPKEVLVEINKRMYGEIERSWFVTMTIAYFDLEKKTVKFCRAGHMPLLTALNGTVQSFRTQGIGVGLEKGIIFERTLVEEEIQLTSGQIYTFYTDGITEAMNNNEELFGEEKLKSILKNKTSHRSSEILNEVWTSLNTFRGTAEVNDDMTMVIVKVE